MLLGWLATLAACSIIGDPSGTDDRGGDADAAPGVRADAGPPCVEGDTRTVDEATGHCYSFFETAATWEGARSACEAVGGDLVGFTSQAESDLVLSLIPAGDPQVVFIGGTDVAKEDVWAWVDGDPWGFEEWKPGQPDNSDSDPDGEEDCLTLLSDLAGQWNDRPCEDSYPYMCERAR